MMMCQLQESDRADVATVMQNRCHFTGSFVDYLTTLSQLMDVVTG
jgi:hypothetical protein